MKKKGIIRKVEKSEKKFEDYEIVSTDLYDDEGNYIGTNTAIVNGVFHGYDKSFKFDIKKNASIIDNIDEVEKFMKR